MRIDNVAADALAKVATDALLTAKVNYVGIQSPRALSLYMSVQVLATYNNDNWMTPIRLYLDNSTLTATDTKVYKIRSLSARYILIHDVLYRRGYSSPLLRCVDPEESNYLLREIHESICGAHGGGRSIAHKALRQGYYWPTIRSDAMDVVQKCLACQRHPHVPHLLPADLQSVTYPWPSTQW